MLHQLAAVVAIAISAASCSAETGDSYTVTWESAEPRQPVSGRVILFFITETGRRWNHERPIDGPFFHKPQPIASIAIDNFKPGDSVTLTGQTKPSFPDSLDALDGTVRVQAILDCDRTERSHTDGPGNAYSDERTVEVSATRADRVDLVLKHTVAPAPDKKEYPTLKWVKFRSPMLSEFYGRDVYHMAGVALPPEYNKPDHPRQHWPAVYEIPGYGERTDAAEEWALALATPNMHEIAPYAVHIVLDPESPLGHHGFVDSPNHGPRGTAFVKEFIPWLESQFRLVAKPEARILTGHSSGGWSSLWLQLQHPETFGACWSSAPDPVDFSAFQMTDLYGDANIYVDPNGQPTPSFRHWVSAERVAVLMTVKQENAMEYAIDPSGGSGQQWDAWEAMFSPRERDAKDAMPTPLFDPLTGTIDKQVVAHWSKFDIAKMVTEDWARYGPILRDRVRLACGDQDSFYLNRAVERLKEKVEKLQRDSDAAAGEGYIWIVENADHGTILGKTLVRWNSEKREYLRQRGLQD